MDGVENHTVKISSVRWPHGFFQKEPVLFFVFFPQHRDTDEQLAAS